MTFLSSGSPGARVADTAPDLYLPTNAQSLLAALASALVTSYPAEIVYLEDGGLLPPLVEKGIRKRFPQIVFSVRSDLASIEEFATLPRGFPSVLRRNIAITAGCRIRFPQDRPPHWLGQRYRTAYIYLSGNFVAKTLRLRCQTIVLREEGLVNYHTLHFGRGHALLRLLTGRSAYRHIMGEEAWIDRIEVNEPEALPVPLQAKARKLSFSNLLGSLPEGVGSDIAKIFWEGQAPPPVDGAALILTQPIDLAGFCTPAEKADIYNAIKQRLAEAGYQVVVKRHPREMSSLADDQEGGVIPAFFPIEAWPWLTSQRFDVAVALCTSALDSMGGLFSRRQLQLVDPVPFGQRNLAGWRERLDNFLQKSAQ